MGKAAKKVKQKDDVELPMTDAMLAYEEHRKQVTCAAEIKSGMAHGQKDTPAKRAEFLQWLTLGATPTRAAKQCNLGRRTVFQWREKFPEFAAQWAEAVACGTDRCEDEALRRAVDGTDRPVFQQGVCVGLVREYSDDLLKFILMGRLPSKYAKSGMQGGAPNGDISFTFNFGNGSSAKIGVHASVDGAISDQRNLRGNGHQSSAGSLRADRSDDESGEDGGLPSLVNGKGVTGSEEP